MRGAKVNREKEAEVNSPLAETLLATAAELRAIRELIAERPR